MLKFDIELCQTNESKATQNVKTVKTELTSFSPQFLALTEPETTHLMESHFTQAMSDIYVEIQPKD